MRVLGVVGAVAVGMAVAAPGAVAGDNAATKSPLRAQAHGSCDGTDFNVGLPQGGFAILKQNGDGTVSVAVSVKGGPPDAAYFVDLVQTPSGAGCNQHDPNLELTTNGDGNGNAQVNLPVVPGTSDAFVLLEPANAAAETSGNIASQDVTF
jgi:hypothetical protein